MKPEIIRMSQLEEGQAGVVAGMRLLGGIRRRMLDLGLITGTRVVCLRRAPEFSRWIMPPFSFALPSRS